MAQVNPATLKALELEFGVNTTDPLWVQYLNYLNNLLHGNLGVSTNYYPTPVIDIIGQDIKWTLVLALRQRRLELHASAR